MNKNEFFITNIEKRNQVIDLFRDVNKAAVSGGRRYIKIDSLTEDKVAVRLVDRRSEKSSMDEVAQLIKALYPYKIDTLKQIFGEDITSLTEQDRTIKVEGGTDKPVNAFLARVSRLVYRKSVGGGGVDHFSEERVEWNKQKATFLKRIMTVWRTFCSALSFIPFFKTMSEKKTVDEFQDLLEDINLSKNYCHNVLRNPSHRTTNSPPLSTKTQITPPNSPKNL